MTDQPGTYYQQCADELNRCFGSDAWNAEMVADIERLIGKPLAEMTLGEMRRGVELAEGHHAQMLVAGYGFGAN
jgi:hypothetical protein